MNVKDKHIFYSVCSLAIFVLCAIGIGYATDVLPRYKPSDINDSQLTTDTTQGLTQTSATAPENEPDTVNASLKKKDCPCCRNRTAALKARIENIRNKRLAKKTEPQENK